jgi:hypothetical protein
VAADPTVAAGIWAGNGEGRHAREWEREATTASSLEALKAEIDSRWKKETAGAWGELAEKGWEESGGCVGCPWGARLRRFIPERLRPDSKHEQCRAGPSNLLSFQLTLFRAWSQICLTPKDHST